jgi:hypothetical protein
MAAHVQEDTGVGKVYCTRHIRRGSFLVCRAKPTVLSTFLSTAPRFTLLTNSPSFRRTFTDYACRLSRSDRQVVKTASEHRRRLSSAATSSGRVRHAKHVRHGYSSVCGKDYCFQQPTNGMYAVPCISVLRAALVTSLDAHHTARCLGKEVSYRLSPRAAICSCRGMQRPCITQ